MKFALPLMAFIATGFLRLAAVPAEQAEDPPSITEVDLASDRAWTLRCDEGPARPIKVPGGGWNSDQQSPPLQVMKDVRDHVVYERKITVPNVYPDQAVELRFGAVTYGCEVFLDGKKVGEHHGPQVAFEMDLTDFATPGKEQTLQVKAYHRRHYLLPGQKQTAEVAVGWDYPAGSDDATRKEAAAWYHQYNGDSKVGYGIVRSIKLAVLPGIHVQDVFVRPSVTNRQLTCDLWLRNATNEERTVTLGAALSSWNKRDWKYPTIPDEQITLPAKTTVKTTLGPISWNLGPESYWWPNIPYRENYTAQLHDLNFEIKEGPRIWQKRRQRFGFVEHGEGPFYYTVNGVRVTGFSDATAEGQTSYYDSYSSAAWLPPTGPGTGAPESWRRYMRIEYMMEAADEVGFMLIPEAPIWGNRLSRYDPNYTPQTYHDIGEACRNHPSVARYSLSNEVRDWPDHWPEAIDDMREVDDIHPLVYELDKLGHGLVTGPKSGSHAWIMEHYTDINEKVGEGKGIRGMGENFWKRNSMGEFAVGVRVLRLNDWCYMSGWSWLNYWPNFLQGMNHDLHAWKPQDHADRKDGIDGWGSPLVRFTQRSLNPFLIQDRELLELNPGEPLLLDGGKIEWPYQAPVAVPGKTMERPIEVFNGGLTGDKLTLDWSAHWDTPTGPVALSGGEIPCVIEPGFHATEKIAFDVPAAGQNSRKLYLVMDSRKDGQVVFHEDNTWFDVVPHLNATTATFVRGDDKSQGDWQGKFGEDGDELIGHESKLPSYAKLQWTTGGSTSVYDPACNDPRALAYFANPPTGKDRVAAGRYGEELAFILDLGATPQRLSLYFLDYDKRNRRQSIEIADASTGKELEKREIANFTSGRYLSWNVQGAVKVTLKRITGDNAMISGIFLDPVR
jgi:hypothetical protein